MPTFRVGDLVEVVHDEKILPRGMRALVSKIDGVGEGMLLDIVHFGTCPKPEGWYAYRFKLIARKPQEDPTPDITDP